MAEWAAMSASRILTVLEDGAQKPNLFMPTDVIFLAPRRDEVEHLRNILSQRKPIVFFSSNEQDWGKERRGSFVEDLGQWIMEALLAGPVVGQAVVHRLLIPWLRSLEREDLIQRHGGYDFPGAWAVQHEAAQDMMAFPTYWPRGLEWWVALRLPLRLRKELWMKMRSEFAPRMSDAELVRGWVGIRALIDKHGAHAMPIEHPWMDLNTPLDIVTVYRGLVSENDPKWRSRLRETFDIEAGESVIESSIEGNLDFGPNSLIK